MATTQNDIRGWIQEAKEEGATHLVVCCDTFDYEDYPISVMPNENVQDIVKSHDGPNMQKVMEVYNLSMNIEPQIKEKRSWHL